MKLHPKYIVGHLNNLQAAASAADLFDSMIGGIEIYEAVGRDPQAGRPQEWIPGGPEAPCGHLRRAGALTAFAPRRSLGIDARRLGSPPGLPGLPGSAGLLGWLGKLEPEGYPPCGEP